VVEHRTLLRAQLAIDAGDQLGGTGAWLVPHGTGLDGAAAQPADQLTQPFGGSRPLFAAGLPAPDVRELFGNFGEIDLEVVDKDIVHGVVLSQLRLSKRWNNDCQGQFGGWHVRGLPCTKMLREP